MAGPTTHLQDSVEVFVQQNKECIENSSDKNVYGGLCGKQLELHGVIRLRVPASGPCYSPFFQAMGLGLVFLALEEIVTIFPLLFLPRAAFSHGAVKELFSGPADSQAEPLLSDSVPG